MIVQNNLNGRYKDIVHFINDQKETTKEITISVKTYDLHLPQDLIILTSPMIRSILQEYPSCITPHVIIPDMLFQTIHKFVDVFTNITCSDGIIIDSRIRG